MIMSSGQMSGTPTEIMAIAADRSRARFFHIPQGENDLVELKDLVNSDSRMPENELVSDRQGRAIYGGLYGRRGRRTAFGKSGSKRYLSAGKFAARIAEVANAYANSGSIHVIRLYVIASPEFMGAVRVHLRGLSETLPVEEIMKNITRQDLKTIRGYLPERLWPRRVAGIELG